jgi:hypothetical protein
MSQLAVKLQTDQQPILFKFLETHIIYLRDFIVTTGKISMRELLKPPLRQSSFTNAILTLPPQPSLSLHGGRQTARGDTFLTTLITTNCGKGEAISFVSPLIQGFVPVLLIWIRIHTDPPSFWFGRFGSGSRRVK